MPPKPSAWARTLAWFNKQSRGAQVGIIGSLAVLVIAVLAIAASSKPSTDTYLARHGDLHDAGHRQPPGRRSGRFHPDDSGNPVVATTSSAPPAAAAKVVPAVSGRGLDLAEATLKAEGIGYQTIGGGTFGVLVALNWQVCSQSPTAGVHAAAVDLVVAGACS